jgi:DNA-binding NarL/FixJ family response regulator
VITVLVADDQALVRTGIRKILESEPDIEVVGEAADGRAAARLARSLRPDLVLMDIRMPELNGLDATTVILEESGGATRVVILSTFDLDDYVFRALRAGASGFLLKTSPAERLVHALHAAVEGDAVLAPSVTRRLIDHVASQPAPMAPPQRFEALTPRESEVLNCLARGLANAEIAAHLHLAPATVKTHIASLLQKLQVRDRVQLVIAAYQAGVVTPHGK